MQKSYPTGLILAAACSSVASAAVTVQLSLNIDPITQTFLAYANVIDTSNQTLGLHGLEFNISGTGGVSVLSSTSLLPNPTETLDNVTTYQKGFSFLRSNGSGGAGIRAFQLNINQISTTGSGLNNIIEGFGETASTENNGLNASTTITQPALIASGSYTGSAGSLSISGSTDMTTLLPASLPTATVGGAAFSTFSPNSVTGQSFSIPFVSTWTGSAGDNNWNTNNNWSGGLPGFTASGDTASFTSAITNPTTVNLNGNKTVGVLNFNNLNPYTLAQGTGSGTLTLNNGASNAAINDSGGSHFISAPVSLASNTTVTISSTFNTLTISGDLSGTGALVKAGAGTLSLTGTPGYSGSTTVAAGRLKVSKGIQNDADLILTGGTLEVLASGASSNVMSVGLVQISGATTRLELHNNDLISNYGAGPSNYTTIYNQVKAGLTLLGGAGTSGITSVEVDNQTIGGTVLAVVDDGDPNVAGGITSISGFAIPNPATSVLVKYTWFGDANLDGIVDGSDYALVDTGFVSGGALTGWVFGDFNYDGIVLGDDYALIDTGFIAQSGTLPEPGMIGLLSITAFHILVRRRRSRLTQGHSRQS